MQEVYFQPSSLFKQIEEAFTDLIALINWGDANHNCWAASNIGED